MLDIYQHTVWQDFSWSTSLTKYRAASIQTKGFHIHSLLFFNPTYQHWYLLTHWLNTEFSILLHPRSFLSSLRSTRFLFSIKLTGRAMCLSQKLTTGPNLSAARKLCHSRHSKWSFTAPGISLSQSEHSLLNATTIFSNHTIVIATWNIVIHTVFHQKGGSISSRTIYTIL
jgi:hypothetical protein